MHNTLLETKEYMELQRQIAQQSNSLILMPTIAPNTHTMHYELVWLENYFIESEHQVINPSPTYVNMVERTLNSKYNVHFSNSYNSFFVTLKDN